MRIWFHSYGKRLLSLLLAIVMLRSVLPVSVFTEENHVHGAACTVTVCSCGLSEGDAECGLAEHTHALPGCCQCICENRNKDHKHSALSCFALKCTNTAADHKHTEACCLSCGKSAHTHTEACGSHTHTDSCYTVSCTDSSRQLPEQITPDIQQIPEASDTAVSAAAVTEPTAEAEETTGITAEAAEDSVPMRSAGAQAFADAAAALDTVALKAIIASGDEAAINTAIDGLMAIEELYFGLEAEEQDTVIEEYALLGRAFALFYEEAATYDQITDSLNDCLTGIVLKDSEGKVIDLKSTDINTQDIYIFEMKFEETANGNQFDRTMRYTFPNDISLQNFTGTDIYVGSDKVGTFSADNGRIMVTFVNDWETKALNSSLTGEFKVKFSGSVNEPGKQIDLGNGTKLTVNLITGSSLNVTKEAGSYDEKTHTFAYKITVKASGAVEDAVLSDKHDSYLEFVPGSLTVDNVTETVDATNNPFTANLGNFSSGQTKIIEYKMKISDKSDIYKEPYVELTFHNEAEINGTYMGQNVKGKSAVTSTKINQKNFEKKGVVETVDGREMIKWMIFAGDSYKDIGSAVVDTLGPNQTLYKEGSMENNPIRIDYVDRNGNKQVDYGSNLGNIVIPSGAVKAEISYYTQYTGANAAGTTKYTNAAKIDKFQWSTSGSANVSGAKPDIRKNHNAVSADDTAITYVITVDVPAGVESGGNFFLRDTMEIDGSRVNALPSNVRITVDDQAYTDFEVVQDAAADGRFLILFEGANDTAGSVWPYADAKKLVITYELPFAAPIAKGSAADTLGSRLDAHKTLKNTVRLQYTANPEDTVEAEDKYYRESQTSMDKRIIDIDTSNHTIEYVVTVKLGKQGSQNNEAIFTFYDDFDDRLAYVIGSFTMDCVHGNGTTTQYWKKKSKDNSYDYTVKEKESGAISAISIDSQELTQEGDGGYGISKLLKTDDTLVFHYKLKIKDDEYAKMDFTDTTKATIDFDNNASITMKGDPAPILSDKETVGYPKEVLSKEAALLTNSTDTLEYTIDHNPRCAKLNNGRNLTLVDTMSGSNLSLMPASIRVYEDKNGVLSEISNAHKVMNSGSVIEFTLKDGTHYKIVYQMKVTEYGSKVPVTNTVSIQGYDGFAVSSRRVFTVAKSSASASSSCGSFTIYKYDQDTNKPLPGAQFKLYTQITNNTDAEDFITVDDEKYYCALVDNTDGNYYETNADGYVVIENKVLVGEGSTYILREHKEPTGYIRDTSDIRLIFNPTEESPTEDCIHVSDGGSIDLYNSKNNAEPYELRLPVTKIVNGTPPAAQTFTFRIERITTDAPMPEDSEGTQNKIATVTGSDTGYFDKITFAEAGTYEYTITETQPDPVPEGYTYDPAVYTLIIETEVGTDNKVREKSRSITVVPKPDEASEEASAVTFTNLYRSGPDDARIFVRKDITGTPPTAQEFRFRLEADASTPAAPLPSGTTGSYAEISILGAGTDCFNEIAFHAAGTYRYKITEVIPADTGNYIYDPAVYYVTYDVGTDLEISGITCEKASGAGTSATTEVSQIVFENRYSDDFRVSVSKRDPAGNELPGASLTVSGTERNTGKQISRSWKSGETPHTLALKAGSYVLTETAAPKGYRIAAAIRFTVEDDGSVRVNGAPGTDSTVVMVDQPGFGDLQIKKTVTGNLGDKTRYFSFRITLDVEGRYAYSGSSSGYLTSGDTVRLRHGEYITIRDLPVGTNYKIVEGDNTGYKVTAGNSQGTIGLNATAYASFVNSRSDVPNTGEGYAFRIGIAMIFASVLGLGVTAAAELTDRKKRRK